MFSCSLSQTSRVVLSFQQSWGFSLLFVPCGYLWPGCSSQELCGPEGIFGATNIYCAWKLTFEWYHNKIPKSNLLVCTKNISRQLKRRQSLKFFLVNSKREVVSNRQCGAERLSNKESKMSDLPLLLKRWPWKYENRNKEMNVMELLFIPNQSTSLLYWLINKNSAIKKKFLMLSLSLSCENKSCIRSFRCDFLG